MDIEDLSFIGRRKKDEPGKSSRHFWRVEPTGDYIEDCKMGDQIAQEYLEWSKSKIEGTKHGLLVHIISDMPREMTGIEDGFLKTIDSAAIIGVDYNRRLQAYIKKFMEDALSKKSK